MDAQTPTGNENRDDVASETQDAGQWALPVEKLVVDETPAGATDLNLAGRPLTNPLNGFGALWRRTYRVRLTGVAVTPAELVAIWKANFAYFQPLANRFMATTNGVTPGELLFIDSTLTPTPGIRHITPISSGVMVMYADATSFSVMTPVGFPVSGWNTFSAYDDDGVTVAQVQVLDRSSDPIYEFGYRFMGGEQKQDGTWSHVLRSLAAYFGVSGEVMIQKTCIDDRLQWRNARNVWYNASLRTFFHRLTHPFEQRSAPPATPRPPAPPPFRQTAPAAQPTIETRDHDASKQAWARPIQQLDVDPGDAGAINLNVRGRGLTGPLKGFGQLWQKTYWVRLVGSEVTPHEVINVWKAEFPTFWPDGNRFYGATGSIEPGDVALLNLSLPGGASISTGVYVIFADAESFSFMTPQGHMFAGMITFSSHQDEGATVAQVQALVRPSDPLYELGCRMGVGHKAEDAFWHGTLHNLAARFGVAGFVEQRTTLVDPRVQWAEAGGIWHNAAVRTTLHTPLRLTRKLFGRG